MVEEDRKSSNALLDANTKLSTEMSKRKEMCQTTLIPQRDSQIFDFITERPPLHHAKMQCDWCAVGMARVLS